MSKREVAAKPLIHKRPRADAHHRIAASPTTTPPTARDYAVTPPHRRGCSPHKPNNPPASSPAICPRRARPQPQSCLGRRSHGRMSTHHYHHRRCHAPSITIGHHQLTRFPHTQQTGFYATLAVIPAGWALYYASRKGSDNSEPFFTRMISSATAGWNDQWAQQNAHHVQMLEQAGADRALFNYAQPVYHVDMRFPEYVASRSMQVMDSRRRAVVSTNMG